MRNTWKDWRFWVCAALFAALFCLLAFVFGNQDLRGPVSITYMVFAYVPIALAAGSWLLGLYKLWTDQWGREDLRGWGFLVLICGSTSFPMCIHSTGPWICMGVSLLLGIGAILYGKGPAQPLD